MKRFKFHVEQLMVTVLFFPLFGFGQHFSTSTIEVKPFPAMPYRVIEIDNVLNANSNYTSLGGSEKEWFYWTNYSRTRPKAFWDSVVLPILRSYPNLVSNYTASLKAELYKNNSLPFILPNDNLEALARGHANDLSKKKSPPSHSSTNGISFQQRFIKAGIRKCAAENISFGPPNTILALVFLYIDEKLPDLGHRRNLLSPVFNQMGIGIANYPNDMVMVIQDFACDQNP